MDPCTTSNLFVNLSNHSSLGWSEEQLLAAKKFGQICDLTFPLVNPSMTSIQVQELANQCVSDVLKLGTTFSQLTVHVMGEMTLVYHIVASLKRHGVRCVASTTERVSTEADGKKVSEFHFVQFREY